MYNYQQFIKQSQIREKSSEMQSSFYKESQSRKSFNRSMTNHHQKRINTFLLSMIDKPIEIKEYRDFKYEPRGKSQASNRTSQSMRLNAHTTAQRLKDIHLKNKYLDEVPFNNPANHKFREEKKNTPKMPIKLFSSATVLRLYDHLMKTRTNEVQVHLQDQIHKIVTSSPQKQFGSKIGDSSSKSSVLKSLMPSLHRKTYFNSLKNLLVDKNSIEYTKKQQLLKLNSRTEESLHKKSAHKESISANTDKQNARNSKQPRKDSKQSILKNAPLKIQSVKQHLGIRESAIQALMRCKLMKKSSFRDEKTLVKKSVVR